MKKLYYVYSTKYQIKLGADDTKYLFMAKGLTYVVGFLMMVLAIIIYRTGFKSILDLSNKYIGLLLGPIIGIFLVGMLTRRAKTIPTIIAVVISISLVIFIDRINASRIEQEGKVLINMYWYGPITITTTFVLGYLGSLFGEELPYEKVEGLTIAKKKT